MTTSARQAALTRSVERMEAAITVARAKGAVLNRLAVIAQAALESGWWRSRLCVDYNNLFGIKAGSSWTGPVVALQTVEWNGTAYIPTTARWRVYPSWNECLVDYSQLVQRLWWFRDALPYADPPHGNGDYVEWLAHLVDRDTPGELTWATGPRYVEKCVRVLAELQSMGLVK
jgi:flagellum-specific peptidoglycan hydrolase FlgJ